jgi:hypothetical protein
LGWKPIIFNVSCLFTNTCLFGLLLALYEVEKIKYENAGGEGGWFYQT